MLFFCKDNVITGGAIFEKNLPRLRKYLGPLVVPGGTYDGSTSSEYNKKLVTGPRLNAEEVIIECIRGNEPLVSEAVPRELFVDFGKQLNMHTASEISSSPLLEFFELCCLPMGSEGNAQLRNQEATANILLSEELKNIRHSLSERPTTSATFRFTYPSAPKIIGYPFTPSPKLYEFLTSNLASGLTEVFSGTHTDHKQPEKLVKLVRVAICKRNDVTASRFQDSGIVTLQASIALIGNVLIWAEGDAGKLLQNGLYKELMMLLYEQLAVLVVDPQIFKKPVSDLGFLPTPPFQPIPPPSSPTHSRSS